MKQVSILVLAILLSAIAVNATLKKATFGGKPSFVQLEKEEQKMQTQMAKDTERLVSQIDETNRAADDVQRQRIELGIKAEQQTNMKLTKEDIRNAFQLRDDTDPVLPAPFQLEYNSGHEVNALEVTTKVNFQQRLDAFVSGNNLCWKKTWDRGVGTIPDTCTVGDHPSLEAGLCYRRCNAGEHGGVTMCIKDRCPDRYCDAGLFCTYCNGPLLKGKGCCCTIFGCCNKDCGEGYDDDGGCLCRAKSVAKTWDRGVGYIPTGCSGGRHNEAGLCYKDCGADYTSFATSCWGKCTGSRPYDCGAACAGTKSDCISGVFDMVLAPLMIVVNIATAGELGAAIKAGKLAAKTAIKMGAKELIKAAGERIAKGLTKDAVKKTLKDMAKNAGKFLKDAAVEQIVTSVAKMDVGGNPPDADLELLTALDPTGISDVVIAYANPIC